MHDDHQLSNTTLDRLRQRAAEENCSVDTLLTRLLDQAQKESKTQLVPDHLYHLMVDNSQDAITLHTPDGRFLYVNPANVTLTGYTVEELLGMSAEDMVVMVHPDDLQRTREEAYQNLLQGVSLNRVEYRLRRKDGTDVWVENRSIPLLDENGDITYILSSTRDITERKQAQRREFELALEKERLQLMTSFIQNATHEFRTPLSIIGTSVHLMAQADELAVRRNKAEQVQHQVWHITNLVDMLLEMVKLESSAGTFTRYPVDIGELVEAICEDAINKYGPEPELNYTRKGDLLRVSGEGRYLAMAFKQLLDNAFRFTGNHGKINLTADAGDGHVWLKVCDTGPGIPPEMLPDIFKTFWRQDTAHTTPGLGLGLSLAHKIIERHEGEITVESEIGKGTCFRIKLPVLRE